MDERRRTADRVFYGSLAYTAALTLLWLFFMVTRGDAGVLFAHYTVDREAITRVFSGFLFFSMFWGYIWYGIKSLLLRVLGGFSEDERRLAFSSRMDGPFDVSKLDRDSILSAESRKQVAELKSELAQLRSSAPPAPPLANAVEDGVIVDQPVLIRGVHQNKGDPQAVSGGAGGRAPGSHYSRQRP